MKNKIYLFLLVAGFLQIFSCKKDSQPQKQVPRQNNSLEKGLINFSINGELTGAFIDTTLNTITVVVPDSSNKQKLTINFTLASQVSATLNNMAITSGVVYDLSKSAVFTVTSADKKSTSFSITVLNELQYFGLGLPIVSAKSLDRDYNFYFDQWDGSTFESVNCGPTVTTMAIKWADSTFSKLPVDARKAVQPQGAWWTTGDVQLYLHNNYIDNVVDTLQNIDSLVKKNIDDGNAVIFCLDMYYVPYNRVDYQHISKFYQTAAPAWGHFLLAKGYKKSGSTFFLEMYDPYSDGNHYPDFDIAQLKGQDRYYASDDIQAAATIWWPYVIVVAPRGKKVTSAVNLQLNSINKIENIPVASGQ